MPLTLETPSRERPEPARRNDDCLVHRRQRAIRWHEHGLRHRSAPWLQLNHPSVLPSQSRTARPEPSALFNELADQWELETVFESIVVRKALHPAYQRIIGMGRTAVPLILERLKDRPQQWFWALTAITGEDPALGETTLEGASYEWLRWGRERGLLGD